jgi:hypothetical protein
MRSTPYPVRPCDVVALTVPEFTCQLDSTEIVSIDVVCQRFPDEINRALVWFIRFRALTAWCARTETASWLRSQPSRAGHACELAASFELNERWEFDADRFRSAVDSVAARHERPVHAR